MDGLKLEDCLQVNCIVWMQSLQENEVGPSNRMFEELQGLSLRGGLTVERIIVANRKEAAEALHALAERSQAGLRPIIHFDCHGSKADGLYLEPSGEFFSWPDLADGLRPINVATQNSLCCIFGVCFGLYFSFQLRLSKPSPYFLTIAPEEGISVGTLESRTGDFYRRLNETGDITRAYADVLKPNLELFYSRAVFAEALAVYVNEHCRGKAGAARRERLLTEALLARGISSPSKAQLKEARTQIKEMVMPSQALIDRFAQTFLIGREAGFGIAELERLASGRRRHHTTRKLI